MRGLFGALALALALALAMPLTMAASPAPAGEATPTLTVTGAGTVRTAPDIATIRIGVETDGKTAAQAMAENNDKATRMIDSLKAGGVAAKDIQTGQLSVQPRYADRQRTQPGEPPRIVGYHVANIVTVTVRKLDSLGQLLDRVVRVGANRIDSIGFGLADDTAKSDEARRRAVADARRRAGVLAEAAGVRLVRVLSIHEGGGVVRPMQGVMAMRAEAANVPVERGQVEVSAHVTMVWQIAPAGK